jgi:hypothetical protein
MDASGRPMVGGDPHCSRGGREGARGWAIVVVGWAAAMCEDV